MKKNMDTRIKKYVVIIGNKPVFETYAVSINDVMALFLKQLKREGKILLEQVYITPINGSTK